MSESPDKQRQHDELRRLNRLYSVLSQVNHAMVQMRSPEDLMRRICESVVAYGGLTLAWIGWLDEETGDIKRVAWAGEPREYLEFLKLNVTRDAKGLTASAINSGEASIWNDFISRSEALPWQAEAKKAGLRAAAAFPISLNGQIVGALTAYANETHFFGSKEVDLLTRVAVDVSFGLNHLKQEARRDTDLEYERDLLRALMDNCPDHIYFKDRQSRFIRCSKAMCDRFGTTPREIVGKTDADFFEPEHAQDAYEDEQHIMQTGEPLVGKVEKETWKRGEDSWVLTAKLPFRNHKGQIIGTLGISKDFTAIKKAEASLEQMHKQLTSASRLAGMAEVSTSVLHNVGNVLNSVNISSSLISDKIQNSKVLNLSKVAALLQEHAADLPGFFANNPKGKQVPAYLADLARYLAAEREELLKELTSQAKNLEHIKEVVSMQQSYARLSGTRETLQISELIEDAIRLNSGAIERHHVHLAREFSPTRPVSVDKHKLLQILVNLIQNSKCALNECDHDEKRITFRLEMNGPDRVRISVIDNGSGIKPENLPRIFDHGFTTRKNGHGFGLHSGALAAREMGGTLTGHSDGPGKGATFTLELPCQPPGPQMV